MDAMGLAVCGSSSTSTTVVDGSFDVAAGAGGAGVTRVTEAVFSAAGSVTSSGTEGTAR